MRCSIWGTWTTRKQSATLEKRPVSLSWDVRHRRTVDLRSLFWIILAATAICSIFAGPLPGFGTAVLLASIGTACSRRNMAVCAVFILMLSVFLSLRADKQQVWLGLESPVLLELRTRRDSRPARQGSLHFFELIRVYDRRGNGAEARGEFLGWSRERLELPWGAEVRMRIIGSSGTETFDGLVLLEPLNSDVRLSQGFMMRESWRRGLFRRFLTLPPQASVLLEALLFGSKQRLLSPLEEGFRRIGCSHLLALSGMHLAVIMTVGAGLLGLVLHRRAACCAVTLILPWYLFLVGPSPALLRAGIMFSCSVLIPRSTRSICFRDLLLQSFVVLLAVQPSFLYDRGFQYSYAALAGMVALSPILTAVLVRIFPYFLAAAISCGISAYMGSLPVSLSAYGITNPAGIAATILLSPLIWFYLAGGIIFFLLPGVPIICETGRIYFWILYRAIQSLVELFSRVPSCSLAPEAASVLAFCIAFIITARLIYSCLRFTMHESADQEECSE